MAVRILLKHQNPTRSQRFVQRPPASDELSGLAVLPARVSVGGRAALPVSCLTGEGSAALLDTLTERAMRLLPAGNEPLLTRARHRAALQASADALARFSSASAHSELAFLAEDLRLATRALGGVTGRVAVEDVLDGIFA